MGAEKTFADFTGTNRVELQDMLDAGGLSEGDTLLLRQVSDLGKGAAATRHQKRIAEIGATIEVVPTDDAPRVAGRKPRLSPSTEQLSHLCTLWYSAAEQAYVLGRASEKMGAEVTRDQMNRWCGPRNGSDKPSKLKEQKDG